MNFSIYTPTGNVFSGQSPLQGQALLDSVGESAIVLVKCHALANGAVHRTSERCDPTTLYDLSRYNELYRPDRQFFGRIAIENASLQLAHFGAGSSAELEKEVN